MKEVVVISGKGGTGKTSIVGSFAVLAESKVLADCDVDAADLHLLLDPQVQQEGAFSGGKRAAIRQEDCTACGDCLARCRFDAVQTEPNGAGAATFTIDPVACEGCGVCAHFCPVGAIDFTEQVNGMWFVSKTAYGPMVHARLGIAEENSGKLVSLVKQKAREIAEQNRLKYLIVDGPPGIGCPVIASLAGADLVVMVTEPTRSGAHDLERVIDVAEHFGIPAVICINKCDLNSQEGDRIADHAAARGIPVIGRVRYDDAITASQVAGKAVVERCQGPVTDEIKALWEQVRRILQNGEGND